jgi:chloramphenicol-sensitive protein RarD
LSGRQPPYADAVSESRRGFLFGLAAYVMWGSFPLYWTLLDRSTAPEILANRIVWSAISMGLLVLLARRLSQFAILLRNRRAASLLALAAVLVSINWVTYIWSVNNGHVVESSLGYFINPLVSVLLGVGVLQERLRRVQWIAMGVATIAVVVLTLDLGRLPWIALILACTFGTYGLVKKVANVGAIESLTYETVLISPIALAYLLWLGSRGDSSFAAHGPGYSWLLIATGIVTALPLICFGAAATRVPLVTIGLLQYVAPVFQFGLGVLWFHEDMPPGRWAGFLLVWVALAIFTAEALTNRRRQLRDAAEASAI